eukprot:Skav225600  [mRNA]  locus=scaffold1399:234939:237459:- [translate_table: standard]
MAPQTHKNMQNVVLGFIQALLSKDPVGDPFKASHRRWTELPIEMWFGRLRQRAPGCQFNSKQYWAQSAAEMMRQQRLGVGETDSSILRPPTDQEFKDASVRAVKSAVQLASWCLISAAEANEPMNDWERDPQEDWEDDFDFELDAEMDAKRKWNQLLKHVRDECAASLEADESKEENPAEQEKPAEQAAEVDEWHGLVSGPDGLDLQDICEATHVDGEVAESDMPGNNLLTNLRLALRAASDRGSVEMFDKLWRLLMSGNIVALVVPKRSSKKIMRSLIVAYVTSVWKSNKQPKLVTTAIPLSQVVAFRVTEMSPMDHSVACWDVKEDAVTWVLKPEALLAVLAPSAQEDAVNLGTNSMTVQLSGESLAILDSIKTAPQWWPSMPEDGQDEEDEKNQAVAGLFVSRKKRKRRCGAKNHAQDARAKNHAEDTENAEKKNKKNKKNKKSSRNLLKKARKEKQVPCDAKNFRRNGLGPILVAQTMVKMKCLEEEVLPPHKARCFDADGKCMVQDSVCEGIMWEDVVNHAHPFLCAELPVVRF